MQKLFVWRDTIFKYLVAAIILVVPLYAKFPFIKIPGTFVSIRAEDFLIAITSFFLIFYIKDVFEFFKSKMSMSILLFLAIAFTSLLSAVFITKTVVLHIGLLHFVRRIEYFLPLVFSYIVIKKDKTALDFYLKLLFMVVFLSFLYGLGQKYLEWPIIITQNQEYSQGVALRWRPGSHINSTFAGHYDLATYLVMILPIVVNSFFVYKNKFSKLTSASAFFAGMWLLVNSASRVSLASYLLAVSISLLFLKKYKAIPVVVVTSIIFIAFSSNLLARYERLIEVTRDRFFSTQLITSVWASDSAGFGIKKQKPPPSPTPVPVFEDRSTSIRFNVEWPRAIRAFSKNPLLGTGYSSITLATDNDYLRLIGEVGILGFASFALIFLRIFQLFLTRFPLTNFFKGSELVFLAGFFGSLPGLFTNAVFIDIFEASKFATSFWLLMGMALFLIKKGTKDYEK